MAAACGEAGAPGLHEQWTDLDAARARWSTSGIVDYEYRYTRSCECLPSDLDAPSIEVRDGVVARVWDERTGATAPAERYDWYFTVADLFTEIEQAIEQGVHRLDVAYHPILGHPTTLTIDYDERVVDEELILPTIGPVSPLD